MKVRHNEEKKQFELLNEQEEVAGILEYMQVGNGKFLYATHTEVYPAYEGNGYAALLLDAISVYAREKEIKIVPLCAYVIGAFRKYPDKYADVMKM